MLPTNADPKPSSEHGLVAEAKAAIVVGDRARALALLDGLRHAPADQGQELAPVLAEALVATARGGSGDEADRRAVEAVQEARTALRQILDWLASLPFDGDDLLEIQAAVAARRSEFGERQRETEDQVMGGGLLRRLGAGWLEWRWISKPSGRQFGPYVYYRWREEGRKRTKYLGKVGPAVSHA